VEEHPLPQLESPGAGVDPLAGSSQPRLTLPARVGPNQGLVDAECGEHERVVGVDRETGLGAELDGDRELPVGHR
jgi:hypothetical protein